MQIDARVPTLSLRRALFTLAIGLSLSQASCASDRDDGSGEPDPGEPDDDLDVSDPTEIEPRRERSLVITDLAGLTEVAEAYSLGRLLEDVAVAVAEPGGLGVDRDGQPIPHAGSCGGKTCVTPKTAPQWVDSAFRGAAEELDRHNAAAFAARLGVVAVDNPLQRLRELWSGKNGTLDSQAVPAPSLGAGPFRLLAVVNRLDLAGDKDGRDCCLGAVKEPKPFGEGRLVFGLVDPRVERGGAPAAFTIIIEYRLPALDAELEAAAADYDYRAAMTDDAEWRTQMARWGGVWLEQSRTEPSDPEFQRRLAAVVGRFARPENFLAIRAGFEVVSASGRKEFEYREWYMNQTESRLIPRKPSREPYRCGAAGATLTAIVEAQWDDGNQDLAIEGLDADGASTAYEIPRDSLDNTLGQLGPMVGCPTNAAGEGLPFEMSDDNPAGEAVEVNVAPFARFREADVWTLTGLEGSEAYREDVRHTFAIRTCSGCHGREVGVFGFHVRPRLADDEATLSAFMTGEYDGGVAFSSGGADYHYDALGDRTTLLVRAATRDPALELYAALRQHDRL
jgi:hypothetical protein